MALLDSQGRLFGKINLLDAGAGLLIFFVLAGIFLFPGRSGTSIAGIGVDKKTIEVDVIVLGLKSTDPKNLIKEGSKASFIVRNQSAGDVKIKKVTFLPRTAIAPQPNGTLQSKPDPRPEETYSVNMILTLEGEGQLTDSGPVVGGNKIKVGTPIELDGDLFNFKPSVIDVRVSS
ncbi:MAG: DUF4330 domain-containing protein [Acaryochloridaceae cyanobacterium SU_2_1]|nr:DUF4330 domain-containing protein [Acaryochloridaceae cyanobacterium SU_2_1]